MHSKVSKRRWKKEIPDRLSIYKKLTPYCDFFDIEIFSDEAKDLRKLSAQHSIKLIASYHRFDSTPSLDEIERVFEEGRRLNPDVVKIATMVNKKEDTERLLLFLLNHKNDKLIVIGMGQNGKVTRIINPVFGSLITYACLNTVCAPGQISLQEMLNIFMIIGLRK